MRLRSVIIVLVLLFFLIGTAALFYLRRAAREQPAPYVLIEPPTWLPLRMLPTAEDAAGDAGGTAEMPWSPFGARKALRMATLRNDDAQAAGFATLSVFERGSRFSLEIFLPPLPPGNGYDVSLILHGDSAVALGNPLNRGDGWHALQKDFPDRDLGLAQRLRISASVPQEPSLDGMTVVDAQFQDVMD